MTFKPIIVTIDGQKVYGETLGPDKLRARFDVLDALSRTRALTDAESHELEKVIYELDRRSRKPAGYDAWLKSGGRIG